MSHSGHRLLAYVELAGPVEPGWLEALRRRGVELLQYRSAGTYLGSGTDVAFRTAEELRFVRRVVPVTSAMKPRVGFPTDRSRSVWVVLVAKPPTGALYFKRVPASLTEEAQRRVLAVPHVLAVESREPPVLQDEVTGLILAGQYDREGIPSGSYLEWLRAHGLDGVGVTIGIVDSGVNVDHPAFAGRIRDLANGKQSWHGTAMAGLAAGRYLEERDEAGYLYGLGVAPAADLLAQDRFAPPEEVCRQTVTEVGPSGVPGTVQNNSFGKGTRNPMDYGSEEALYDLMVRNSDPRGSAPKPLTICFAAGNEGTKGLNRPAGAKNVLVTGNSSTYRPRDGGIEAETISAVYSGNYDTGFYASSLGNCGDGRIRPHVVAPGQWSATANHGAQPGERRYLSRRLTWGGGTSGATALTSGACALLTQWWRREAGRDPSPALLRALVVNGAVDTGDGGPIPNRRQGWGRLNLENILAPDLRRAWLDQSLLFTSSGQQRVWPIRLADAARPLKITFAWTDPPGPLGSGTPEISAIVNRLALRVEVGEKTYFGNHFAGGWSIPGAAEREGWDNLQNVYLPAEAVAEEIAQVSVTALEIAMDCLTGRVESPRQDFALWISNGVLESEAIQGAAVAPLPGG
jgi:subtilisin family serine protease